MIECEATESEVVEKVATPEPFIALVPSVAAPSLNVTVPVGTPVPGLSALAVAVNVTFWPDTDGFAEEAIAEVVADLFTVCVRATDALAVKLVSPP